LRHCTKISSPYVWLFALELNLDGKHIIHPIGEIESVVGLNGPTRSISSGALALPACCGDVQVMDTSRVLASAFSFSQILSQRPHHRTMHSSHCFRRQSEWWCRSINTKKINNTIHHHGEEKSIKAEFEAYCGCRRRRQIQFR